MELSVYFSKTNRNRRFGKTPKAFRLDKVQLHYDPTTRKRTLLSNTLMLFCLTFACSFLILYLCEKSGVIMKITLNHNSPVPLYIQIEEQIREAIRSPEYKEGKKLPNEVDLSKQLGIARSTLRQAINKLVFEGLLTRKKGVGTVVVDAAITSKARNWLSFSQEMQAMGIKVKNYELHVGWVKPTEELCRFFNIDGDSKILKLERLRGKPEHPFVFFISYFNPRIGLTGDEDFSRPLYDILERDYNTIVKLSKEEISAKAADRLLADKLEITVGDPILKRMRFVYDPGNRPVEWNVGYYRADSFVYTIESEREI